MPVVLDVNKSKNEYRQYIYDGVLYVGIKASHLGYINSNNWFYIPTFAKDSVDSWTTPYYKPFIKSHEMVNSEPIGRIIYSELRNTNNGINKQYGTIFNDELKNDVISFIKKNRDVIKDPAFAQSYVYLIAKISDKDAIEKILDGRYKTVSVSASTDHAVCSICGTDWSTGDICEHDPYMGGIDEDGNPKCFIAGNFIYDELSIVNNPADKYAVISEIYTKEEIENILKRSINMSDEKKKNETTTNVSDQTKTELEKENETLKTKVKSLEDKIQKLEQEMKEKDEKIKVLDEVNKTISDKLKDIYLLKIVDIYQKLGKDMTLEQIKEKYGSKTIEQIEDYISLISELTTVNEKEEKEKTTNPEDETKEETKTESKEETKAEDEDKQESNIKDEFKEKKYETETNTNEIPIALKDAAAKMAHKYGSEFAKDWLKQQLEKLNKGDK